MKNRTTISKHGQGGSALILVMIMSGVALAILASVMLWSSSSARLTHRTIQYTRSVSAAEAATEKVVGQISRDFLYGGENLVLLNLNNYRQSTVPTTADSSYWANWKFNDGNGNNGQTYVQQTTPNQYQILSNSAYAGLRGYVTTFTIVSHASDQASPQDITGGVYQELQLTGIPIFQFAMYSMGDMEISCGQPFDITGPVHSNHELFVEPDNAMTFESGVTAVIDVVQGRNPLDTRGTPAGLADLIYKLANATPSQPEAPVPALNLPIGTTNSPEMIREIIEPPPANEDPASPLGRLRYYNECDMIVTISDNNVVVTSGMFDNKLVTITNTDVALFISTNSSGFYDAREGKTVMPVDIDVGKLKTWSETNNTLRPALGFTAPANLQSSIYVVDNRNVDSAHLTAVRVTDAKVLGTNGLTVATGRPLYVLKDFNQYSDANLGSSNTTTTRPASLVADAITILSDGWTDGNSTADVSARIASPTTVNAALLTGVVETTAGHYSGGMENFPRFLETWGSTIFTYNGSMVKMFPSLYATGMWGQGNVYAPPKRNWAFDSNFNDATKLPPKTPSLLVAERGRWSTVTADTNGATAFR